MSRTSRVLLATAAAVSLAVFTVSPSYAGHHAAPCEPACVPAPVCAPVCPLPPVEVALCVVDPVTCCKYPVTVCVPAECACAEPCYAGCRPGVFGRKILTYKWPCGHCVDIVITKHGKTIVRD